VGEEPQTPPETGEPERALGQIACSMVSCLLSQVRMTLGHAAVDEVIRMAGVPYTAEYLNDVANWIWYEEAVAIFEAGAEITGDPRIGLRAGELSLRQHAGTAVATLLRSLGSPEAVLEQTAIVATKFSTITEMRPLEVAPGRASIVAVVRPEFEANRLFCDFRVGLMSQTTALFGLPAARVEETTCRLRGDEQCRYEVRWNADDAAGAADPQQLITSLEAQLAAMAERLNNIYAAAKDLIAVDDLDVALARITERAATAVRAPRYLLAVRTADGQIRAHHRGFDGEDVDAAAAALLADDDPSRDPSRLVADVASMTRNYGRLMAVSPSGTFFPHERELLEIYASYAATVLDTATALDESRRQHARSSALLELSQAIAAAGRSDEVAQQLVDAVPAVVDCDRVSAFLWRPDEGALTCGAMTGLSGEALERVRDLCIKPDDTGILSTLIETADPTPLFFDQDTEDGFLAGILRQQGSLAMAVAPIVAHGHFYGVLTVSAVDRPERLRPTPDLLDRLAGVAAQSATALDNARLIETMAHQAATDNLTGLLGHRAFHEALGDALGGDETTQFTLATIDIDDFKLVNDSHGHPVGDEALCRVAEALRSNVRSEDRVFRVGGEEFAVLMPGLSATDALPVAERLRKAVAATAFDPPLRISIGLASWPTDARDREDLLRRADEALYAAKRGGKDRTALVAA
jgi:diguanylate cyclase (GGDEF)-like protein